MMEGAGSQAVMGRELRPVVSRREWGDSGGDDIRMATEA